MTHPEFTVGSGTVGTTPQPLGNAHRVHDHIRIKAAANNGGIVYVSTVATGDTYPLTAGEESPRIHIDDVSKVYVRGSQASQGYRYFAA